MDIHVQGVNGHLYKGLNMETFTQGVKTSMLQTRCAISKITMYSGFFCDLAT